MTSLCAIRTTLRQLGLPQSVSADVFRWLPSSSRELVGQSAISPSSSLPDRSTRGFRRSRTDKVSEQIRCREPKCNNLASFLSERFLAPYPLASSRRIALASAIRRYDRSALQHSTKVLILEQIWVRSNDPHFTFLPQGKCSVPMMSSVCRTAMEMIAIASHPRHPCEEAGWVGSLPANSDFAIKPACQARHLILRAYPPRWSGGEDRFQCG